MSSESLKTLLLVTAGVVLAASSAQAQSQGKWEMKAPVPAAISEVGLAAVNGKVHVFGGSVLGFTGPYHVEYDPATDKWTAARAVPESARSHRLGGAQRQDLHRRRVHRRRRAQGRPGRRL